MNQFIFFPSVAPVSRTFIVKGLGSRVGKGCSNLLSHADGPSRPSDCCSDGAQASSDLERLQKVKEECPDVFTVLPFDEFSYFDRPLDRTPFYSNYQLLPMLSINVLVVIECANVKHLLE